MSRTTPALVTLMDGPGTVSLGALSPATRSDPNKPRGATLTEFSKVDS
jgi:hypothetical protein